MKQYYDPDELTLCFAGVESIKDIRIKHSSGCGMTLPTISDAEIEAMLALMQARKGFRIEAPIITNTYILEPSRDGCWYLTDNIIKDEE